MMISCSHLYLVMVTVLTMTMTMISCTSASTNTTLVSCEDMVASYKALATVRRAFGCDLGYTTSGVPSSCDEGILTSLKSCSPVTMSCLVSGITSTCSGHADICDASSRVFLGLQQTLSVWCGPDSETNDDCPWYKELGCEALVEAAIEVCAVCPVQPELCAICVGAIMGGSACADCVCIIRGCC